MFSQAEGLEPQESLGCRRLLPFQTDAGSDSKRVPCKFGSTPVSLDEIRRKSVVALIFQCSKKIVRSALEQAECLVFSALLTRVE